MALISLQERHKEEIQAIEKLQKKKQKMHIKLDKQII
ncbi:hypothetical protein YG5714_3050 [Sulfolobus islandicus Y.G.57.14]|uniref:Uncharacterized protein n=3 Tax=Saccharolobus islandicus TaxID=43080 RepID=C3MQ92_SACI2|nr:hypothetical protein LS215_2986 [Sulfolobus islandicus L.S.2.15]ACP45223.1 hypothetical protein YG5714_3050 [Sulfolobus islandicus Y.G.57.14]ACP48474.1 hypothetical protein YN1551_1379 [Sulfolobus islandicus Y.N.15.51]